MPLYCSALSLACLAQAETHGGKCRLPSQVEDVETFPSPLRLPNSIQRTLNEEDVKIVPCRRRVSSVGFSHKRKCVPQIATTLYYAAMFLSLPVHFEAGRVLTAFRGMAVDCIADFGKRGVAEFRALYRMRFVSITSPPTRDSGVNASKRSHRTTATLFRYRKERVALSRQTGGRNIKHRRAPPIW
ncbi:hypothetical protein EVAR_47979_1 [Eumeta japonica]|uniref:Uncharacterized protein n=1 Tax=Eumeta variegata TaxID=151549 RepID=A0A4C1XI71_EUMVA|nr:hypothetical protein EVAR_47979_1 [Eumeta japonica]